MYKMKDVCQMTGLTEKAIRIYMAQKLVEPKVEEGVHRKAYFFSENDVERLKDISTLRNAGFSIAEIKQMQEKPEQLPLLIEARKELLEGEILQKLALQDALKHLTIEEHGDAAKLADAIEPRSAYAKETPKKKVSRRKKWGILILIAVAFLVVFRVSAGEIGMWIAITAVALVNGIIAVVSGIRYLIYSKSMKQKKCRGIGKITAVVENEKIEEYIGEKERSIGRDILAYLTFGMFGEGIWKMLRPDAWYPVISYQTKDGKNQIATTRYGAFQNSWSIGDEIALTWEDEKERLVHICDGKVFLKKAYTYMLIGLVLLMIVGFSSLKLFYDEEFDFLNESVSQMLEYPVNVDRVEIMIGDTLYEMNEEEIEVLRTLFQEAKIGTGRKYHIIDSKGVATVFFYNGEKEMQKFIANDYSYIFTSDGIKYKVEPISIEFRGIDMGDTPYITGFFDSLGAKVVERYAVDEVLKNISDIENLEELKKLLEITENFMGAYKTNEGYRFVFTEQGYKTYFGKYPNEEEYGEINVIIKDGDFVKAIVTSSYFSNEEGTVETYRREW